MSFGQVFFIKFVLYLPKCASGDKTSTLGSLGCPKNLEVSYFFTSLNEASSAEENDIYQLTKIIERVMEINSNPPILYYGFNPIFTPCFSVQRHRPGRDHPKQHWAPTFLILSSAPPFFLHLHYGVGSAYMTDLLWRQAPHPPPPQKVLSLWLYLFNWINILLFFFECEYWIVNHTYEDKVTWGWILLLLVSCYVCVMMPAS